MNLYHQALTAVLLTAAAMGIAYISATGATSSSSTSYHHHHHQDQQVVPSGRSPFFEATYSDSGGIRRRRRRRMTIEATTKANDGGKDAKGDKKNRP